MNHHRFQGPHIVALASTATSCLGANAVGQFGCHKVIGPFQQYGEKVGDQLGASVSTRGTLMVAGAPMADINVVDAGGAWIYRRYESGVWDNVAIAFALNMTAGEGFGTSVAIIDENMIAVGSPGRDAAGVDSGAVLFFSPGIPGWPLAASLDGDFPGQRRGAQLAAEGDLLAATSAAGDGSVSVFRRAGTTWALEATLDSPGGAPLPEFGAALAFDQGVLFVGAPGDDGAGTDAGAVHVYGRIDRRWTLVASLVPPDGVAGQRFGAALGAHGGLLAVGAPSHDVAGSDAGAIHIFVGAGSTWTSDGSLLGMAAGAKFGRSVAVGEHDRVAVGAPGAALDERVWLCLRVDGAWRRVIDYGLAAASASGSAGLGESIAVDGARLIAGAPFAAPPMSDPAWPGASGLVYRGTLAPNKDCDGNGVEDSCDIVMGFDTDLNDNSIPDGCDDCDDDGIPDQVTIAADPTVDCDGDFELDSCQLVQSPSKDCNRNGVLDSCEIANGSETDCDGNFKLDSCDLASNPSQDCDGNGIYDPCDIAAGRATDCNGNGKLDSCDIAADPLLDCDGDGVIDLCEAEYAIDDHDVDLAFIGGVDTDVVWLNEFAVEAGKEAIIGVEVCWVGWTSPPHVFLPAGTPATIMLLGDPNDDGAPDDATLLASITTTVDVVTPNVFQLVPVPTTIVGAPGDRFFVAVLVTTPSTPPDPSKPASYDNTYAPCCADEDPPGAGSIWLGIWEAGSWSIDDLSDIVSLTAIGFDDHFLLRAVAAGPGLVGDVDCDGAVTGDDIGALLAGWGPCPAQQACVGDVNHDGVVDGVDLGLLLGAWQ